MRFDIRIRKLKNSSGSEILSAHFHGPFRSVFGHFWSAILFQKARKNQGVTFQGLFSWRGIQFQRICIKLQLLSSFAHTKYINFSIHVFLCLLFILRRIFFYISEFLSFPSFLDCNFTFQDLSLCLKYHHSKLLQIHINCTCKIYDVRMRKQCKIYMYACNSHIKILIFHMWTIIKSHVNKIYSHVTHMWTVCNLPTHKLMGNRWYYY